AQVLPFDELLEDDLLAECGRTPHGRIELVGIGDIHADAASLLAARGLDDERTVTLEELEVLLLAACAPLLRHAHADPAHQPLGHELVVAAAHRDRARQLAQRLAAHHPPPAA